MKQELRLKEILKDKGMSGSELARRLGVSASYTNQILHGTANISIKQLKKVADILDISMAEFFVGYDTIEKKYKCPHCGGALKITISKA